MSVGIRKHCLGEGRTQLAFGCKSVWHWPVRARITLQAWLVSQQKTALVWLGHIQGDGEYITLWAGAQRGSGAERRWSSFAPLLGASHAKGLEHALSQVVCVCITDFYVDRKAMSTEQQCVLSAHSWLCVCSRDLGIQLTFQSIVTKNG